ncbi:MAG: hypothetical protein AAFX87_16235 [Bacteroidota bacterium]
MRILFYKFAPQQQVPETMNAFKPWFEQELGLNANLEPDDLIEITTGGLVGGKPENLLLAQKTVSYFEWIKPYWHRLKAQL